ncbi:MAG: chloride channel protein [Kiritimatiellae bacterium]|nr:chloride channel protein [Kiritimatiellia bacterium]
MFKRFTFEWLKFWVGGGGISVKTGRIFVLCAVVGVASGLAASGFYWLLDVSRHYLMESLGNLYSIPVAGERSCFPEVKDPGEPIRWMLVILPIFGGVISSILIKWFAPDAAGHGTDSCIFSFHHKEGDMSWKIIPVKAVSSSIVIGSGGSAGSEGPITQIAGACGSLLGNLFHVKAAERRVLMVAGLSAGVGAIFRAPLAGALFGAEILYSGLDIEYEVVIQSLMASTIAYAIFCFFFGWQSFFAMPDWGFDNPIKLVLFVLLALVVSLGAKLYILIFRKTEQAFRRWDMPDWLKPGFGGLVTGIIGYFVPEILGAGYGVIQGALVVDSPLVNQYGAMTLGTLLLIFLGKIVATSFTVGSGASGGLFGPALVSGSTLGAAFGLVMQKIFPMIGIHPGAFALVGMAGFLAATVRTPLAAIIMVSEISGNHQLLLPTMWVCGMTYWLGNGWTIYRSQVLTRDRSPAHT